MSNQMNVKQILGKIKRLTDNVDSYKKSIKVYKDFIENPDKYVTEKMIKNYKIYIKEDEKKMNKCEAQIAELKGMIEGRIKEFPIIREFVRTWAEICMNQIRNPETIENCIKAKSEMKAKIKKVRDDYVSRGIPAWKAYQVTENIEKSFLREWGFVDNYINHEGKIDDERLVKNYEYEAERKYNKFIEDAECYVGEITDVSELSVGMKGDLNGFVSGTKGKARVKTISAEGMIQRFHYRTLFKMMK